jgi:nitroreductase
MKGFFYMPNPTIELINKRKSIRLYDSKAISKSDRDILINAALQAPSAGNLAMYSIIEVTDPELIAKLAVSCDDQPFIKKSQLILIFLTDYQRYYDMFTYQGIVSKPHLGSLLLSASDACIAAQNVVIAAESLNIGSCYVGDIMEKHDEHVKLLNLPKYVVPICMLVLGYKHPANEKLNKPNRFLASDIVHSNAYHRKDVKELEKMYTARANSATFDYKKYVSDLASHKLNTPFFEDMGVSIKKYIEEYLSK